MSESSELMPVVTLTESAVEQLRTMLAKDAASDGKCLRVFVEQGGCSGLQYGMEFTAPREGDLRTVCDGVSVVVEPKSADALRGSVIDYEDSLSSVGFKIQNPNARQSCGCGKSFEA